jgi:ABC-type multidrug transport system ATPase subunit
VGRSAACDVVLSDDCISREHARLSVDQGQVWIEDLDSRHGTFVNNARVRKARLRAGDVVRFGSGPAYPFDGQSLCSQVTPGGMGVELLDVSIERGGRRLLEGVNLSISDGSFVGVLGPSGSGKSLLLQCLSSGAAPSGGEVRFDGELRVADHLEVYRSMVAVVTQDDLVYEYLTVEENLRFGAMLRLPDATPAEIARRVERALDRVDLQEHREKLVRVLSGGQRKRVAIAGELLTDPRMLLLDEPTSGLDPGMQARLMNTLRKLAGGGITVVCTTHTMDTVHFFDSVAVLGLTQGIARLVFAGPPMELLPKFEARNPADLFDQLQAVGDDADPAAAESRATGPYAHRGTTGTKRACVLPLRARTETASLIRQAAVVAHRSLLGFWRDRGTSLLGLLQPLILAFLVVWTQHAHGESAFINFFLVIAAIWLGMTLTVREIVRERLLYVRDRLACLSPDAYLGGKLAYAAVLTAIQTVILYLFARLCIATLMASDRSIAGNDLLSGSMLLGVAVLFLSGFGGTLIGLGISALVRTERAAVALMPLILLPQVLLSRVAFGDGVRPWSDLSPFGPIADCGRFLTSGDVTVIDKIMTIVSTPLLSRPGLAVLDLPVHGVSTGMIAAEWLYFAIMLLAHLLVVFVLFRHAETSWPRLLR